MTEMIDGYIAQLDIELKRYPETATERMRQFYEKNHQLQANADPVDPVSPGLFAGGFEPAGWSEAAATPDLRELETATYYL